MKWLVLLMLCGAASAVGQTYNARTDVNVQAYPSPIPCPYSGSGCTAGTGSATGANYCFTPSDFATEICRATDVNSGGPQPSYGTSCSGSGEVNIWSNDDTRFQVCSDGSEAQVESFNPSTYAVATLYPTQGPADDGALGGCSSNAEFLAGTTLWFSYTTPKVAYGESFLANGDTAICQYDFTSATTMPTYSNGKVTTVVDLSTCVSALAGVGYGTYADDVNTSGDDQTFAALGSTTGGQGSSGTIYVIVWNRTNGCRVWNTATGAVTGSWGTTGTISLTDTFLIHNIRISKSGNAVKVITNDCTGGGCESSSSPDCNGGGSGTTCNIYIWNIATLTVNRIVADSTDGCGHSTIGWALTMNLCSGFNTRPFTSNDQAGTDPVSTYPSPNSNQDGHGGFNNGNNTDTAPVFWSKAPENTPGSGLFAPVNGWDNEINAVRLDGSGSVYRFAHTYATYDDTDNFDGEYAIGNVSPDGKFYAWASDWDGMLGVLGGGSNSCTIGSNCRTDAFVAVLPLLSATTYVSQSGGSFSGGSACNGQTAVSVATYNSSGGNPVTLCGTITSQLVPPSSGVSGTPIVITFDTGANLTSTVWGTTGAINLGSNNYITIDGGSNGVIANTANGSALANKLSSTGVLTTGGNVEIRNLTIANLYVHSSLSDTTVDQTQVNCIRFSGSSVLIHNNTMHDAGWCLYEPEVSTDANVSIYQNTIYNIDHGWALAPSGHSGGTNGPFSFYNNTVYGYANWDTTAGDYHHDGVHCYTSGTSGAAMHFSSLSIYNNIFNAPIGADATAHIFIEGGTGSGSTPCADSTSNIYVYNNVAIGDQAVNNGLMGIFSGSVNVYNNTMIGAGTDSGVVYSSNSDVSAETFENNVLSGGNQLIAITGSIPFTPDYNIYANGGSNSFVCGSNFYSSAQFSSWQSCISGDSHSSYNTSAGLNSSGMPQSGSAAINAGANLTSLSIAALDSDINGSSRPGSGAWTAGAFNYISLVTGQVHQSDSW